VHREKLCDRRTVRVEVDAARKTFVDGVIKAQLTGVDQLHHLRPDDRLRDAADGHLRVRAHRSNSVGGAGRAARASSGVISVAIIPSVPAASSSTCWRSAASSSERGFSAGVANASVGNRGLAVVTLGATEDGA